MSPGDSPAVSPADSARPPTPVVIGPGAGSEVVRSAVTAGGGVVVGPAEAEVAIWERHSGQGFEEWLSGAPGVGWVQLPSAGIDWLFDMGLYRPDKVWTCAKGAFGDTVAELALALLLAGFRDLHTYLRAATWLPEGGRPLQGSHVAIVGGGGIAASLLERLQPFGVETTVVRRQAQPMPLADRVVAVEQLPKVLSVADAVVLAAPLTAATRGLIGSEELALMGPGAWLVNVGRGEQVVTAALVEALQQGRIGGAALDVTDPEPLPDDHTLWRLPNAIITPHVAATEAMSAGPFARRVGANLRRWRAGEPLMGIVLADDGF